MTPLDAPQPAGLESEFSRENLEATCRRLAAEFTGIDAAPTGDGGLVVAIIDMVNGLRELDLVVPEDSCALYFAARTYRWTGKADTVAGIVADPGAAVPRLMAWVNDDNAALPIEHLRIGTTPDHTP